MKLINFLLLTLLISSLYGGQLEAGKKSGEGLFWEDPHKLKLKKMAAKSECLSKKKLRFDRLSRQAYALDLAGEGANLLASDKRRLNRFLYLQENKK